MEHNKNHTGTVNQSSPQAGTPLVHLLVYISFTNEEQDPWIGVQSRGQLTLAQAERLVMGSDKENIMVSWVLIYGKIEIK